MAAIKSLSESPKTIRQLSAELYGHELAFRSRPDAYYSRTTKIVSRLRKERGVKVEARLLHGSTMLYSIGLEEQQCQ